MRTQMKNTIKILGAACISALLAVGCASAPAITSGQSIDLPSYASDNTKTAETDAAQDDADAAAQSSTSTDNAEGKWHVLPPEVAAVVDADFEGVVWKIDEESFYIAEAFTELLDDGSIMGSSPSSDADIPDSELILVTFDENTSFYVRTIHNGGDSYEDAEAAFQDLEKGLDVEMKGSFENDVFHATEIRIVKIA